MAFSCTSDLLQASKLRFSDLIHTYHSKKSLTILPGSLVHLEAFPAFDLQTSLSELIHVLASPKQMPIYPHLIKLFYTNLSIDHDHSSITSMVHGKIFSFDISQLGNILNISSYGIELPSIVPLDHSVFQKILFSTRSTHFPWHESNLQPHALLLSKILSSNLVPKSSSRGFIANEVSLLLYAIFSAFPINWSSVIFHNMINFRSFKSLPFGYFITLILEFFQIPLATDVVYYSNNIIDDSSLHEEESSHLNSDDEGPQEADQAATSDLDIFSALVNVQNTQDLLLKNQASLQLGQDALF